MRMRSKVRSIGLDQKSRQWAEGCRPPNVMCTLERDDSGEAQVDAEIQRSTSLDLTTAEAMEHSPSRYANPREDVEGVVPRLARVDHEREIALVGQGYLGGKNVALNTARRVVVVIVQSALSDGDDLRFVEQRHE